MADDDLVARDDAIVWHPATHFGDLQRVPIRAIERAQGPWLHEAGGARILDAISSWWTCIHGHGHPAIVEAIAEQAARLDHVMFAGFTHRSAVELAELLVQAAPPGYGRVFYADCGSAAVEVALKLSYQSRPQEGEPDRRRFATLAGAYHGETLGALSVCGPGAYRDTFAGLLPDPIVLPVPAHPDHAHAELGTDLGAGSPEADAAVAMLEAHAGELTALVVEPLVQCANRMAMHGTGYYRRIVQAAQRLGIHVVADEIAVAFGRTGRTFASSWAGVTPDLLCLSKGLSGGVLPLSCVLVRRGFDEHFRGAPTRSFLHSHTFTGNPITCAAGLASLRLLSSPDVQAAIPGRIEALRSRAAAVAARCGSAIAHVRQAGMVVALEVAPAATHGPASDGRLGLRLRAAALKRGVLLRPLHDTIYWMPPLPTSDGALDLLADVTAAAVQEVLG